MKKQKVKSDKVKSGTDTYFNWLGFRENKPCRGIIEARLYTDTWVTGEISSLGPYSFLNTVASSGDRDLRAAVVLRMARYTDGGLPAIPMEDDFEHYHGGDFTDEMAALASLVLGIRMQAGPIDRDFTPGGDPLGRPTQIGFKAMPMLLTSHRSAQIPRLHEARNLDELRRIENFSMRTIEETNTLIKAARMYQQAVWICDADPALAWILLVSSVETVAVLWAGGDGDAIENLQASLPKLFELLDTESHRDLLGPVSEILSNITRATKKFIDFLAKFAPDAPAFRPPEAFQFSYKTANLKKAANLIYGHRSASLHSGTAFPLPMCIPPKFWKNEEFEGGVYGEIPLGLAMSSQGATWQRAQTPMLLHTFEHIARGAILNWWSGLQI